MLDKHLSYNELHYHQSEMIYFHSVSKYIIIFQVYALV